MAAAPAIFNANDLQAICDIIADTESGLTGPEIGSLLYQSQLPDPDPGITKRKRLFAALQAGQFQEKSGRAVIRFLYKAMEPVRYVKAPEVFTERQRKLNVVLSFCGMQLLDNGKIKYVSRASTLSEAADRSHRLKAELKRRNVHTDVLAFCEPVFLQENYFHAVFETTKSVAEKIRSKTGLTSDGSILVDEALGLGKVGIPRLAFNKLTTETEQSEHKGIMNLLKGMFGTFRNTTAHAPMIKWEIKEEDALDMLSLASLLHRKLDIAIVIDYRIDQAS
ncbi:MAG TPA: TIGR02391 family protein [Coleofasciculaceae cyanobacterium]|jgi:uncharacterized protein (TIGR02391 family)